MKNSFFVLAGLLALGVASCKGQPEKSAAVPESGKLVSVSHTGESGNTPRLITKADFLNLVMDYEKNPKTWVFKGDKPCLIDFYAEWCPPCKKTGPILDELAKEYAGKVNFYKVNIDQEHELASVFNVESIPTFLFCPLQGNPTISTGIARTVDDTRKMFKDQIDQILLKNAKPSASN